MGGGGGCLVLGGGSGPYMPPGAHVSLLQALRRRTP